MAISFVSPSYRAASSDLTIAISPLGLVELADEETMNAFQEKVVKAGGYKTGYGAWVLRPGYVSQGDWNDRTSRCHY